MHISVAGTHSWRLARARTAIKGACRECAVLSLWTSLARSSRVRSGPLWWKGASVRSRCNVLLLQICKLNASSTCSWDALQESSFAGSWVAASTPPRTYHRLSSGRGRVAQVVVLVTPHTFLPRTADKPRQVCLSSLPASLVRLR